MKVSKITRAYSKSINCANYGAPESWVRVEATYEAEVESQDDPIEVSKTLHDAAKQNVIEDINVIVKNIRASLAPKGQGAPATTPTQPANTTSYPAPAAAPAQPAPAVTASTYPDPAPANPVPPAGAPSAEPRRL